MSLRTQLLLALSLLLVAVLGSVTLLNMHYLQRGRAALEASVEREGRSLVSATSEALAITFPSRDYALVRQYVDELVAERPDIRYLALFDESGESVLVRPEGATSDRGGRARLKQKHTTDEFSVQTNGDVLCLASPLVYRLGDEEVLYGTIELELYKGYIDAQFTKWVFMFLGSFTVLSVGTLTCSYFLVSRFLIAPIQRLAKSSECLAKGNLSARVREEGKGELGDLMRSFNDMAGSLEETTVSRDQLYREVQQRRKAEEALRISERRLRDIAESMSDWIWEVDADGRYTYCSENVEDILGYRGEELLGTTPFDLMPPHEANKVRSTFQDIVQSKESFRDLENWTLTKDGRPVCMLTSGVPILDNEGELLGYRGVDADITERKHLEQELLQMNKLESVGQLAAGIAHEINTPTQYVGDNTRFLQESVQDLMGIIDKYADLLNLCTESGSWHEQTTEIQALIEDLDVDSLKEEIPKAIEQSLEGVARVATIVRSMKEFSHPGSDRKEMADVNRAIESTITVARNEWKYVAEMVTEFDPTLPPVPCLVSDLNQVILNMIVNAAHAITDVVGKDSGDKGTITISTHRDGEWVEIRVADTGTGMPESVQSKIFDPFFTTKEVGKGTGQGLSIARNTVVNKHGGELRVESETGHGTTFIIRLPRNAVDDHA